MAIRNKRPQAYNNLTKQNEEVIWPSYSVDFDDGKTLQDKVGELIVQINELNQKNEELLNIIHTPIPIPEQTGVLTYNGLVQAPTWSVDSIRIKQSGNLNGINAGNYVARFDLQEGFTWEDGTTATKEVIWRIEPGFVKAEPYLDGILRENGEVQSMKPILRNFNAVDFTLEGNVTFKDAGAYQVWMTPNSNVRWFDGTRDTRYFEYKVYTDAEYREKFFMESQTVVMNEIDELTIKVANVENKVTTLADSGIEEIAGSFNSKIEELSNRLTELERTSIRIDLH